MALLGWADSSKPHWALSDVSFDLRRGQCLGVIGSNGAGKSTLLKLLAGTLQPSHGHLHRFGRVTAILELGAGFHPEFTGRDNLLFGGSFIGIGAAEMRDLSAEIIAFSELGDAIDRPVKTYSSGMSVRLAFALVTAVQPDLLIIDEALAVGDQHFQKKCIDRITSFRSKGCTVLFCSHSMYHVKHLCDVALWLDGGKVRAFGTTDSVVSAYDAHVQLQNAPNSDIGADTVEASAVVAQFSPNVPFAEGVRAEIVTFEVADLGEGSPPLLNSTDLQVTVIARAHANECPNFGVMLEQVNGSKITGITVVMTHIDEVKPVRLASGLWQARVTFPDLPLHSGVYGLSAYLFDSTGLVVYEERLRCLHIRVSYPSVVPGLVRLPHHWD
jgi:lipopolysaccharide transport system ATP-binding protein